MTGVSSGGQGTCGIRRRGGQCSMPRVPECEKLFKFALEIVTAGLPLPQSSPRVLFCTCPPLCAGALWPMPAWAWRDVHLKKKIAVLRHRHGLTPMHPGAASIRKPSSRCDRHMKAVITLTASGAQLWRPRSGLVPEYGCTPSSNPMCQAVPAR